MPNTSFARRERMNEPWVQSWNTMNVRIRNAAAGTTSTNDSTRETRTANAIATSNARYGTTDVARSNRLRPSRGSAYASRTPRHGRSELEPVNESGDATSAVVSHLGCERANRFADLEYVGAMRIRGPAARSPRTASAAP